MKLHLSVAGQDYIEESFDLTFDEDIRGPVCRNVTIVDDNVYEFEEEWTFNLTTDDDSVILDPSGGVMVIIDEDSKI